MRKAQQDMRAGAPMTFQSWNPYVPRDMANGAREKRMQAKGLLFIPDGSPPPGGWPGVVVAQGLGGPKPHREIAYGRWLSEYGYAALVLDTFGSRGVGPPDVWKALKVTTAMMIADAFGALQHLSSLPEINARRIAIKGYSYGGMVAMITAYKPLQELYLPDGECFAGHIAYYGCSIVRMATPSATGAPMLIMLGGKDKNVSVPRVRDIANDLRLAGAQVDLKEFDCYHQWDGNDVKPRRVQFNLRHCAIRIEPDGVLRDEKSGRTIDGPWSRLWFLLRRTSLLSGYTIQQDKAVHRLSNQAVLDFLANMPEISQSTDEAAATSAVRAGTPIRKVSVLD